MLIHALFDAWGNSAETWDLILSFLTLSSQTQTEATFILYTDTQTTNGPYKISNKKSTWKSEHTWIIWLTGSNWLDRKINRLCNIWWDQIHWLPDSSLILTYRRQPNGRWRYERDTNSASPEYQRRVEMSRIWCANHWSLHLFRNSQMNPIKIYLLLLSNKVASQLQTICCESIRMPFIRVLVLNAL